MKCSRSQCREHEKFYYHFAVCRWWWWVWGLDLRALISHIESLLQVYAHSSTRTITFLSALPNDESRWSDFMTFSFTLPQPHNKVAKGFLVILLILSYFDEVSSLTSFASPCKRINRCDGREQIVCAIKWNFPRIIISIISWLFQSYLVLAGAANLIELFMRVFMTNTFFHSHNFSLLLSLSPQ